MLNKISLPHFMRRKRRAAVLCALPIYLAATQVAFALQNCPSRVHPSNGEEIEVKDPVFLQSSGGKLNANLAVRYDTASDLDANEHFCIVYQDKNGQDIESPVLRVKASDEINLHVVNELRDVPPVGDGSGHHHGEKWGIDNPCTPSPMFTDGTTNLHFHGLNIPPTCSPNGTWGDEVISALIPTEAAKDYKFSIPSNDPPGLFWYHPHVHSLSQRQVLGGMTGALIVDGMENMHNAVLGLRERVLVLRDQELQPAADDMRYIERPDLLPGGPEAEILDEQGEPASQRLLSGKMVNTLDDDGHVKHTVMPPWKDVSINGVPVVFRADAHTGPGYSKAPVIKMENKTEFWRIANAAADTYFRLQVVVDGKPQNLKLIALDGVPLGSPSGSSLPTDLVGGKMLRAKDGQRLHKTIGLTEILLAPGGRAEFIVDGPGAGQQAELVSRFYETNADNDPQRVLAQIRPAYERTVPKAARVMAAGPSLEKKRERFVEASDKLQRKASLDHTLVFHQDDEQFYIEEPKANGEFANQAFDMTEGPRITVRQGEIQEWKIENQAEEAHAFHIHQIHFRVMQRFPDYRNPVEKEMDQLALRDVIELPAWDKAKDPDHPPFVILRMYFNEKDVAGNLLYHCHILEHEDNGMMALIKIESPLADRKVPVGRNVP